MTTQISANLIITLTCTKQLTNTDPSAQQPSSALSIGGATSFSRSFGPTSNPVGQDAWAAAIALVAGAAAIDLTNLTQSAFGQAFDMTGLKLRTIVFQCPPANVGAITVTAGGSNGYTLGTFVLSPNDLIGRTFSNLGAVGSGAKNIALTGTGTDVINLELIFGP